MKSLFTWLFANEIASLEREHSRQMQKLEGKLDFLLSADQLTRESFDLNTKRRLCALEQDVAALDTRVTHAEMMTISGPVFREFEVRDDGSAGATQIIDLNIKPKPRGPKGGR